MSAHKVYPVFVRIAAAIASCFFLTTSPPCFAGTKKDFFQGTDLNDANNYNPAGLPSGSSDVLLTTPFTALVLNAAVLQMCSLNLTADNVAYTISNNTATSTGSGISLDPFMGGGNSISGQAGDLIFVGGMNSSLTIQGVNSGTGSGSLSLGSGVGGSFDVAQASSTLNISAAINLGLGGSLTKTGAGVLNLSGPLTIAGSGGFNVNQGTANLFTGFVSAANTNLGVSNSALGPASDVTLNIQTSVQFRSLTGSVATPSNQAVINLVGTGTELRLFSASGSFAGRITGSGNVLMSGGTPNLIQTFSGNNTYSGTTTVSGSSLRIDGLTSGQGNYTVSGTSLMGGGTIGLSANGTVIVQDGNSPPGRLIPGAAGAVGTLSVSTIGTGGVIFRDTSIFTVDIGASGASDLLAIAGGYIDITGASDRLELNALAGAFDGGTYTIATFDQNLGSGIFNTVTGLPSNYVVSYLPTAITLQPVPELSVFGLWGVTGLFACWRRRRSRSVRRLLSRSERQVVQNGRHLAWSGSFARGARGRIKDHDRQHGGVEHPHFRWGASGRAGGLARSGRNAARHQRPFPGSNF